MHWSWWLCLAYWPLVLLQCAAERWWRRSRRKP